MSVCGGPTDPERRPGIRRTDGVLSEVQSEMPGLDAPPWPGELGQRIYENISAEAWKLWEERMKMILNEYRLMPWQKEAQELVSQAHGGFLLRRRRRAAARVRSATGQVALEAIELQPRQRRSRGSIVKRNRACASRTAASAAPRHAARARR